MQKIKIFIFCFFLIVLLFASGAVSGYLFANRNNQDTIAEYENRLAVVENINRELQNENIRITELNNAIRDNLERASRIAGFLVDQAESDGDTVQRIIDGLSIIEQTLSIIFEWE